MASWSGLWTPALSPPDVCGLRVVLLGRPGLEVHAAGSLSATPGVHVEAPFAGLLLPGDFGVVHVGMHGEGEGGGGAAAGAAIWGSPWCPRGRGVGLRGAQGQALAQGAPVLLALQPHAARDGLLYFLAAAQENVYQFHIWPEGGDRVHSNTITTL